MSKDWREIKDTDLKDTGQAIKDLGMNLKDTLVGAGRRTAKGAMFTGETTAGAVGGLAGLANRMAKGMARMGLAVVKISAKVMNNPVGRFVIVAAGTIAGALGVKSWYDNRQERKAQFAASQADAAALQQDIAQKQAAIAAAQAAVADPNARTDNAARIAAAEQTRAVSSPSVA